MAETETQFSFTYTQLRKSRRVNHHIRASSVSLPWNT
jgi:hypothetical protein